MKKIFILNLFLLISFSTVWACKCDIRPLTKQDFDKYDYIALVKVKTFEPFSIPTHFDSWHLGYLVQTAKFTVEYLENYKGNMPMEFIMKYYNSSCDPGIRDGEEWMIFAIENKGYPTITACTHSQRYSNKKGNIDSFCNDINLTFLRKEFKTIPPNHEGLVEQFYPNKQSKSIENYKNGLMNGKRIFWYANGKVRGQEIFKDGKRDGICKWWFEDGNQACEVKYRDGILVDTAWVWQKKQKAKSDTNKKNEYFLKVFTIYKDGKEFNKRDYFEDGTLCFEQIILGDGNVKMTNVWTEKGQLDKLYTEKWDENSKTFKEEYYMDYRPDKNLRKIYYHNKIDGKQNYPNIYQSKN